MKDAESSGEVQFHLVDDYIAVLFPLSDNFAVVVKLVYSVMGMLGIFFRYSALGGPEMGNVCSMIFILETIEFGYLATDVLGSIASHIRLNTM